MRGEASVLWQLCTGTGEIRDALESPTSLHREEREAVEIDCFPRLLGRS